MKILADNKKPITNDKPNQSPYNILHHLNFYECICSELLRQEKRDRQDIKKCRKFFSILYEWGISKISGMLHPRR